MNIKPPIAATVLCLLYGCASPTSHMINNNFIAIVKEPTPSKMIGSWSGTMGPYLATFQWKSDGSGIFCYSWSTYDLMQKLKYSKGEIQIQDGTKLEIKSYSDSTMTVRAPYFMAQDTLLYKDNNLENASLFCGSKLKPKTASLGSN
ncbi:MAG: hypothetical protein RPT11_03005 [Bermanella sp.]